MDMLSTPDDTPEGVRIRTIVSSDMNRMVSRTTSDRESLEDCALMGFSEARSFLDLPPVDLGPWR